MSKHSIGLAFVIGLGLTSFAANRQQLPAQSVAPSAAAPAASKDKIKPDKIKPGTGLQAEMLSSLDVKKAHVGDSFQATLWDNVWGPSAIVLPHGTKIIGRVLEAKRRTKESPESKLVITFDKAVLQDGSELPLRGVVESVELSAESAAAAQDSGVDMSGASRGPSSTNGVAGPGGPFGRPNDRSPGGMKVPIRQKTYSPFRPTGVVDPNITSQGDASGTLTVFRSATTDVQIKSHATIDMRITRMEE